MTSNRRRKKVHKGDKVSWKSHGQTVHGTVEGEITSRTTSAGRMVDASPEGPQYKVRSDKTRRTAVHRPQALDHRDG
ncbi:DUF2945 domain-containing protein [Kitasatospora purpeofusca]|uniref:DUF2945 domain-containing protein n=1 Tax=Kitasatospora purpeofusca TaxID=67352 RepID=UPI0036C11515